MRVNADAPYEIILVPGARRALTNRLPSDAAFAGREFIRGSLAGTPRRVRTPLRAPFEVLWRATRGEYRIRYRIDEISRHVVILDIDHRRDAYRP